MKKIIESLQWLKNANMMVRSDSEQLRKHANSVEAMAMAWLNVPVAQMSTGQQLIAALNIIQRIAPERCSTESRLETELRVRQHEIHQHYAGCRLERDATQYDIENRAAFFGDVKKLRRADIYAEVMIAHARAATGDETIDNYLAASSALASIEAKSMAEACKADPIVLDEDVAFFVDKLPVTETEVPVEEEKPTDEKPKRSRKAKATETVEVNNNE